MIYNFTAAKIFSLLRSFIIMLLFHLGRALWNASPEMLSAFPGAPPGTDKSHKGGHPGIPGCSGHDTRGLCTCRHDCMSCIRMCVCMCVLCVLAHSGSSPFLVVCTARFFSGTARDRFPERGVAPGDATVRLLFHAFPNFGYQPVNGSLRL